MQVRSFINLSLWIAALVLVGVDGSHAAGSPEQQCQKGRYAAAAKYAQCELKVMAKGVVLFSEGEPPGVFLNPEQEALSKCRVKYTATWAKLQAKANGTGSTCDQGRFTVGGGTVTDNLTALQWEQKTDDATVHDKDNLYDWSPFNDPNPKDADGSAFTSFLTTLNGGCFAGQCDWRLPTRAELETILLESYPCAVTPCIDQAVFGPTAANGYLSSTPEATIPDTVWFVYFHNGFVNDGFKDTATSVRAVRGGL